MSALYTSQIPSCLREVRTTTNLIHFQVNLKAEFDGRIFAYASFKTDAIYAVNNLHPYILRYGFFFYKFFVCTTQTFFHWGLGK